MKKCNECGIVKSFDCFHKNKNRKDGHVDYCKECRKYSGKKWRDENIDKIIEYKEKNRKTINEKSKIRMRIYRIGNSEKSRESCRKYTNNNREKIRKKQKSSYWENHDKYLKRAHIWYGKNKDKRHLYELSEKRKISRRIRKQLNRKTNPSLKIKENISRRINECIRKGYKSIMTEKILGCSIKELMIHLEKQFQSGMTWNNYGKWHIDHRSPCSDYDLIKVGEQKICFHYMNLQPLWAVDNLRKGNKHEIS